MPASPAAPVQPNGPESRSDPTGVERQRAKLDRLGDLALELVEILVAKAREADADLEHIALAVARVSRVVRLTCALHVKLAQTRQAIEKEQLSLSGQQSWRNTCERGAQRDARKTIITRVMARVAEGDESLDEYEADEMLSECRERLDDDTLINLLDRPVSELIAEFCRSLGLTPDWEALAAEAWARQEIEGGDVGAPLAAIVERMIEPPQARRLVPRSTTSGSRPRAAPPMAVRAASP